MNLEKQAKKKLLDLFGREETKDLQEYLNKYMTEQDKELFYKRVNMLGEREFMDIDLTVPNQVHYKILYENELKEVGFIHNNLRQIMTPHKSNPNLF